MTERAEAPGSAVLGDDAVRRCPWGDADPLLRAYHDDEWGRVTHDERDIFERVSLEAFQSGLSWLIVLRKRDAFRAAFSDFDPEAVARMTDRRLEALMQNAGIIRNRRKLWVTRDNARATLGLRESGGLDALVWSFAPERQPEPLTQAEVPSRSPESEAMARALKRHGFGFVGPTTAYALMQALGIVDGHVIGCHRRGGDA